MQKFTRHITLILVLLAGVTLSSFAGNESRKGTAGAQELLIPVGARGIALASSNVSMATGLDAVHWNPAGLARTDRSAEVMFSHMSYFGDINVEYGGLGVNTGFGSLGFTIKSLNFGDIPVTTEDFPDGTGEMYSPTFVTLGVSYSRLLSDRISVGATFNIITEKIMSTSASGVALNAGVQYHGLGMPGLDLGIAIKNIGPNMTFTGSNLLRQATVNDALRPGQFYATEAAAFDLPATLEIGLAYEKKFDVHSLSLMTDFVNNNYTNDEYNVGVEYGFDNLLFLRGGYQFSPGMERSELKDAGIEAKYQSDYLYDFTLGAGLNYEVSGTAVMIDYAYRHLKFMDANHIISMRLGF
ncbi:MAG: PorV/PorQ family protein [Acidobacteriota bacterium]